MSKFAAGSIIFETGGNGLSYQGLNTNHRYGILMNVIFNSYEIQHLNGSLKTAVTYNLQEDTGHTEEGFDFCLAPGTTLVAFPL